MAQRSKPTGFRWMFHPERQRLWLEVPYEDGWVASWRIVIQEGTAVVAEFRVQRQVMGHDAGVRGRWPIVTSPDNPERPMPDDSDLPDGGLTAKRLRQFGVEEAIEGSLTHPTFTDPGSREYLFGDDPWDPEAAKARRRAFVRAASTRTPKRPGRRGRPSLFLAHVADAYVAEIQRGSRKPVDEVARKFDVPYTRVRDWLSQARDRGLLVAPGQGRAWGQLTPLARDLLDAEAEESNQQRGARNRAATKKTKRRERGPA